MFDLFRNALWIYRNRLWLQRVLRHFIPESFDGNLFGQHLLLQTALQHTALLGLILEAPFDAPLRFGQSKHFRNVGLHCCSSGCHDQNDGDHHDAEDDDNDEDEEVELEEDDEDGIGRAIGERPGI